LAEILKSNLDIFNELGLCIEEFGDITFRIIAYPALLGDISIEQIVRKVLDDLETDKNVEITKRKEKIIRTACRASIKAGDNISNLHAKGLIHDLFKCDHPFTCPHGRPTAYKISQDDLEKFFKRK
jgi:DNA mismatch repair protein MutL